MEGVHGGPPRPCFTRRERRRLRQETRPVRVLHGITGDPRRCANIVPLSRLAADERAHDASEVRLDHAQPLPRHARLQRVHRRPVPARSYPRSCARSAARRAVSHLGRGIERCRLLPPRLGGAHRHDRRRSGARLGARMAAPTDHYSVLQTVEDLLGLRRLRGAACACTPSLGRPAREGLTDLRRLIVNADDFGMTAGVTEGILDAHVRGIVTSASLMVSRRRGRATRPPSRQSTRSCRWGCTSSRTRRRSTTPRTPPASSRRSCRASAS